MFFLCSQGGHYVEPHRGEVLRAGSKCPAVGSTRCQGRLTPAPESSPEDRCRGCRKGVLVPSAEVGPVCSFCGAQSLSAGQERSGAR